MARRKSRPAPIRAAAPLAATASGDGTASERGSWLDLPPRWRRIFVVVFFGTLIALVATGHLRDDRSYGFRMFPEVSFVKVSLRRVDEAGQDRPVPGGPNGYGRWDAHDCAGQSHTFYWARLVPSPAPHRLDAWVGTPYGVDAARAEVAEALRWIGAHTPDDCETRGYRAEVTLRRNQERPFTITLEAARDLPARSGGS